MIKPGLFFSSIRRLPLEACFWIMGLAVVATIDPEVGSGITGCLFKWIGLETCPGCGLGRSVGFLFRGAVRQSWETHPFGIFAVIVLISHVVGLLRSRSARPSIHPIS